MWNPSDESLVGDLEEIYRLQYERDLLKAENEDFRNRIEKVRSIEVLPYSQHHAWVWLVRDVMNALDGETDE